MLTLGVESGECIGVLSSARLGHRLGRLSRQLPRSGSPDMSGENKQQLRVPVERLGELHKGLGNGPLDLARLDPADLRSREAAPPRQRPHRQARTLARLSRHLGHRRYLVLHRDASLAASVPSVKYQMFASDAIGYRYSKKHTEVWVRSMRSQRWLPRSRSFRVRTLVFVARERGQLAGAVTLDYFFARPLPEWGGDLSGIDFDNIYYYIRHGTRRGAAARGRTRTRGIEVSVRSASASRIAAMVCTARWL